MINLTYILFRPKEYIIIDSILFRPEYWVRFPAHRNMCRLSMAIWSKPPAQVCREPV